MVRARWVLVIAIGMLFFNTFILLPATAQTPPPDIGDWVIADDTVMEDETIEMTGDVIIQDGGSLTLINCTLIFRLPGQFSLIVEQGGALNASGTTISGQDILRGANIENSGTLLLDNCDIYWMQGSGIAINAGQATIRDCEIHDSSGYQGEGITIFGGTAEIEGNNIYNVFRGVAAWGNSTPLVRNNFFHDNDYGIAVFNTANATSQGNTMDTMGGSGLRAFHDSVAWAENDSYLNSYQGSAASGNAVVHLSNCFISNSSYYGVYALDDAAYYLTNTEIIGTSNAAIVLDINARLTASGCKIHDNDQTGIFGISQTNIKIEDSLIWNNGYFGLSLTQNSTASVLNSTIHSNTDAGIYLLDDASAMVVNCSIHNNSNNGLLADGNSLVLIHSSAFRDNDNNGVYLLNGSKGQVANTSLTYNQYFGIHVETSANEMIWLNNNHIQGNFHGIGIDRPSDTRVFNNTVRNSQECGFIFTKGSNAVVENSEISGSGRYGVFVRDISRPTFYNCTISDSGTADIWIGGASSPTFINTSYDSESTFFNDTNSILNSGWWVVVETVYSEPSSIGGQAIHGTRSNGTDLFDGCHVGTLDGCHVGVKDSTGTTVYSSTTGEDGRTDMFALISSIMNNTGSFARTPHNFTASKGNMSGYNVTNILTNTLVHIWLLGTEPGDSPDGPGDEPGPGEQDESSDEDKEIADYLRENQLYVIAGVAILGCAVVIAVMKKR
jgi:parallel beta-helix repeat protein